MPVIHVETMVHAPAQRLFDLARSIDAHVASTSGTSERVVGGVTSGLIGLGQQVTWEGRHFGVTQRLTVHVTVFNPPFAFEDEMISGAFKRMNHRHEFHEHSESTQMMDIFDYAAPLGLLGWIAENLFLTRYMKNFLIVRATELKHLAESDKWQRFLKE
jgi:ligand-binding SRPBCC domain-containing protein